MKKDPQHWQKTQTTLDDNQISNLTSPGKAHNQDAHRFGQGRKPSKGTGGRSPQSVRWGDSPRIRPPQYFEK